MLELRGAGFGYSPQNWVFKDLSFSVPPGTVTAVLGPTAAARRPCALRGRHAGRTGGCGAQVRDGGLCSPARGSTFGYPALDMVVMGRARHIGVFRSPGSRDRAAVLRAMDRVGIAALAGWLFPTLSGRAAAGPDCTGYRGRFAAPRPGRGSTRVDLKNQARVLQLLRELVRTGMSLLVNTHHPDHALFLADSVVLMGAAGVVTGPAGPLLADAQLSALYGVRVSTLNDDDAGTPRRTVVTPFGADEG